MYSQLLGIKTAALGDFCFCAPVYLLTDLGRSVTLARRNAECCRHADAAGAASQRRRRADVAHSAVEQFEPDAVPGELSVERRTSLQRRRHDVVASSDKGDRRLICLCPRMCYPVCVENTTHRNSTVVLKQMPLHVHVVLFCTRLCMYV